jgi:predicted DNA-binding helix-hairpin-helix protein
VSSRRFRKLRLEDLRTLGASLSRARFFIAAANYRPASDGQGSERLRVDLLQAGRQQSLFA